MSCGHILSPVKFCEELSGTGKGTFQADFVPLYFRRALQEEQKQVEGNLQIVGNAETSAAVDFRNQLTTARLLLEIEIGDARFRLDRLKDFLEQNF
jgi:hypothetical protein